MNSNKKEDRFISVCFVEGYCINLKLAVLKSVVVDEGKSVIICG